MAATAKDNPFNNLTLIGLTSLTVWLSMYLRWDSYLSLSLSAIHSITPATFRFLAHVHPFDSSGAYQQSASCWDLTHVGIKLVFSPPLFIHFLLFNTETAGIRAAEFASLDEPTDGYIKKLCKITGNGLADGASPVFHVRDVLPSEPSELLAKLFLG